MLHITHHHEVNDSSQVTRDLFGSYIRDVLVIDAVKV